MHPQGRRAFQRVCWSLLKESLVNGCSVCGYAVDWATVCHSSKWRLFKNSDRTVEGFHYFAAPGTPFYPGFHNVWNRDWVRSRDTVYQGLGDYGGAREFYSGAPPARIPLPKLVGTGDCIEKGMPAGTVSVLGKSPWCGEIMPAPCYFAVDPLDGQTNHADCMWAFEAVKIIDEIYKSLADGIAAARAFFGPTATITGDERGALFAPRSVIVIIRDHCFVFCEGTTMGAQWGGQILGAGFGVPSQGTYGTLDIWEFSARELMRRLGRVGGGDARRFQFVGHSLGGATCSVAAAVVKQAVPERVVELLTFGCPKPGDTRLTRMLDDVAGTHYVNEGDAVPYVPPRNSDLISLATALHALAPLIITPFQRHRRVILITLDGKFKPLQTERIDPDLLTNVISFILAGQDVMTFGPHLTPRYIFMIGRACPCVTVKPHLVEADADGARAGDGSAVALRLPGSDGASAGDRSTQTLSLSSGDGAAAGDKASETLSLSGRDGAAAGDKSTETIGLSGGDGAAAGDRETGLKLGLGDDDGAAAGDRESLLTLGLGDYDGAAVGDRENGLTLGLGDDDGAAAGDDETTSTGSPPITVSDSDGAAAGDDESTSVSGPTVSCSGCAVTAQYREVTIADVVGKTAYPQYDDANGTFTLAYSSTYNPGFCSWVYDGGTFSIYLTKVGSLYDLQVDGGSSRPSGGGFHYRVSGAGCLGTITLTPFSGTGTYLDGWPATIVVEDV